MRSEKKSPVHGVLRGSNGVVHTVSPTKGIASRLSASRHVATVVPAILAAEVAHIHVIIINFAPVSLAIHFHEAHMRIRRDAIAVQWRTVPQECSPPSRL